MPKTIETRRTCTEFVQNSSRRMPTKRDRNEACRVAGLTVPGWACCAEHGRFFLDGQTLAGIFQHEELSMEWLSIAWTLLDTGRVTVSCFKVDLAQPTDAIRSARGESFWHRQLKATAAKWLQDLGEGEVGFEVHCGSHRADVYSEKLRAVVECGKTPPDRIDCLRAGVQSFTVFPYLDSCASQCTGFTFRLAQKA